MSIEKQATGIRGLDAVTGGGLPRGAATLVFGEAGTGKTVMLLQTLSNAVRAGAGKAVLVGFEEGPETLLRNAGGFPWSPAELVDDGLFLLDGRAHVRAVATGDFQLDGLVAALDDQIQREGVRLIGLDGIDQLLSLLDDPTRRRQEVLKLCDLLIRREITGVLTAKVEGESRWSETPYGFMLYAVDCVVHLVRHQRLGAMTRTLEILKYRGSDYRGGQHPLLIDELGADIASGTLDSAPDEVPRERVGTGVPDLDRLLGGGHWRGSTTLISGAPGTAKTTLAAAFADHMCRQGEPVLFVALDESVEQIARNTATLGLNLQAHIDSGMLMGLDLTGRGSDPAEQYVRIQREVDRGHLKALVIDPISALGKTADTDEAQAFGERTLRMAKAHGLTCVVTSLLTARPEEVEATRSAVSTIADTWIALSYHVDRGERNRALSIVKARGTAHSSQVRELLLGGEAGIALADVYEQGGEVLMGTARLAYEDELAAEEEIEQARYERRHRQLAEEAEATRAKLAQLQAQLDRAEAERQSIEAEETRRRTQGRRHRARIAASRSGSAQSPDGPETEGSR
jgi:circadian clock protein KaiC